MADELNANTDGSASPSPTDVGATGASGADAGQQSIDNQTAQGQNVPEATQDEFSAGWTFDDQPEEQSAIPENDDDIQGLTTDPNLDQKQVPKLVADLRGARAEARQSRGELRQLREQVAKLEQYGGLEGVEG